MKTQINLTQINISVSDSRGKGYENGTFVAVFQDAILAISRQKAISGNVVKVLLFILSLVDANNHVIINKKEIAEALDCDASTVYKSIKVLEKMRIIGADANSRGFTVAMNVINPRLAYHGNTRHLRKTYLPELLAPDGKTPLIPGTIYLPPLLLGDNNDMDPVVPA